MSRGQFSEGPFIFNLSMESKKLDLVSQDDVKNAGGW